MPTERKLAQFWGNSRYFSAQFVRLAKFQGLAPFVGLAQLVSLTCVSTFSVSEAPEEIMVTDITSRSLRISWKKPIKSYGDILGYVVQLHDDSGVCVRETILKCSDCSGTLVSDLYTSYLYLWSHWGWGKGVHSRALCSILNWQMYLYKYMQKFSFPYIFFIKHSLGFKMYQSFVSPAPLRLGIGGGGTAGLDGLYLIYKCTCTVTCRNSSLSSCVLSDNYFCGGSYCFMSWCLKFCAVGALCMLSDF